VYLKAIIHFQVNVFASKASKSKFLKIEKMSGDTFTTPPAFFECHVLFEWPQRNMSIRFNDVDFVVADTVVTYNAVANVVFYIVAVSVITAAVK